MILWRRLEIGKVGLRLPLMTLVSGLLLFLLTSTPVHAQSTQRETYSIDPKVLFENIYKANAKRLPEAFGAELSSLAINLQFRNIPKDMIAFGEKPALWIYFEQQKRPRLRVQHVESFYRGFFSPYEDLLLQSGLFFGVDGRGGYEQFIKRYEVVEILTIQEGTRVHIREREGLPGDYGIYYFNPNWLIERTLYYEAEEEVSEVKWYYGKEKGYILPKRVLIYLRGSRSVALGADVGSDNEDFTRIQFSNYRFDPKGIAAAQRQ